MDFSEELLNLIKGEENNEPVQEILESSTLYEAADSSGATLLHYSVRYNNTDIIEYLLNKGCDVNVQDSMGTTPLMIAMSENCVEALKILLAARVDIFKLNNKKESAFHMLAKQNEMHGNTMLLLLEELKKHCGSSEEIAERLYNADCKLYNGIVLRDCKVIERMIQLGSLVDFQHPTMKVTAMHGAVGYDDLKSLRLLLKYNANVNLLDLSNANPLHNLYKLYHEHNREKFEILKLLLEAKSSTTSCTIHGVFQIHYTLIRGNYEAIRISLKSGINLNAKNNKNGQTILHCLARNKNQGVVDELKPYANKFKVNVVDDFERHALFKACREGNVNMVKFLLKQKVKVDMKDRSGVTPLYYVYGYRLKEFEQQCYECGEMLLQRNADPQIIINMKNRRKLTIFDNALKNNEVDRLKPIIAHLAMLENRRITITEIIMTKINSNDSLRVYFEKCRNILKEQIYERVVLSDLLNSDEKKMVRYLNNENIDKQLTDKIFRRETWECPAYYFNILRWRYSKGNRRKELNNEAAPVICDFFRNQIHQRHVIIDKITDYLDNRDLKKLHQLQN